MATVELNRQLAGDGRTRLQVGVGVEVIANLVAPTATVHQLEQTDLEQIAAAVTGQVRPPVRRKR